MMEMKIKIDVPELVAAVEKLAAAIDKTALNITVPNEGTLNFNMPAGNAPVAPAHGPDSCTRCRPCIGSCTCAHACRTACDTYAHRCGSRTRCAGNRSDLHP